MAKPSRLLNPEIFQGVGKHKSYFEGWYLKHVSPEEDFSFALIPGVAYQSDGKAESFIQFINGETAETHYVSRPIGNFTAAENQFKVRIGNQMFSNHKIDVDLREFGIPFSANLEYLGLHPLKNTYRRPGIMGWYRYMPFMQCYHGLVSQFHTLRGKCSYEGKTYDMNDGHGYIEKDWGRSFPSAWVWMQSNNFKKQKVSVMCSIAHIPWIGRSFTGFLCTFLFKGEILIFTTYTGAKLATHEVSEGKVHVVLRDQKYEISLLSSQAQAGVLKAPTNGLMKREILESINGTINVTLTEIASGEIVFSDVGTKAGVELVGDVSGLLSGEIHS
ncbi:MAG: tocopherol cyclase family protein [Schleiferiaceae bacterium]